ncbi:MAG: agmatine deiminase family protein, partial [Muribaculaceae bacterium]|nr:agmatine deiminase family protein [Muribaculaceae bacterium]
MLALQMVRVAFPEHEVVGVDCTTLIKQHGSLHCATMQIPKGVFKPVIGEKE